MAILVYEKCATKDEPVEADEICKPLIIIAIFPHQMFEEGKVRVHPGVQNFHHDHTLPGIDFQSSRSP